MKMSMNNGEWGDLYFDDPDFPRNLHVWLESLDDTNLVVSSLAMVLLSEGLGFYSPAERIVNQFNEHMKELGMLFDDTVLLS